LALPTSEGTSLVLSYWDLCFALMAVNRYGGDLERMTSAYGEKIYFRIFDDHLTWEGYLSIERIRNHLIDLKRRLEAAAATPTQVVNAAGDLAKTEKWLVSRRGSWPSAWKLDLSAPMRDTPRKRGSEHALRGFWPRFPVSPEHYAAEIRSKIKITRFFSVDKHSAVAQILGRYVDQAEKLRKSGEPAKSQALLRALMTVVIELWQVNSRWGTTEIHELLNRGFAAYLEIPLDETGIDETVFFSDLLDLLIWNSNRLDEIQSYWRPDLRIKGYFKVLNESQADVCFAHLRHEVASLLADVLEDRLEVALDLLTQLIVAQERFDALEDVARQMGSWHYDLIVRLVDQAMKRRKRPLACKIFEAAMADNESSARALAVEYEKLKRGDWRPGRPEGWEDAEDAD
jgi:hypothetical protein